MSYLAKKIVVGYLSCILFGVFVIIVPASPVHAAGCDPTNDICFDNPLSVDTPSELVNLVINAFLGISGSIALVIFIYGGITWMISEGEPEKIKKGLDTMIWAGIGMGIIFASYALVKFVVDAII
ncbi:MAG: pilin [bacterium]|nr:pilin [bacterium]